MIANVVIKRGNEEFTVIVDPSSPEAQELACDLSGIERGAELGIVMAAFALLCVKLADRKPELRAASVNARTLAKIALAQLAGAVKGPSTDPGKMSLDGQNGQIGKGSA